MIRHIFWDWDGTLVDDAASLCQAANRALAAVGLSTVSEAEFRARFTRPLSALYGRLTDGLHQDRWEAWYRTFIEASSTEAPPSLVGDAVAAMERWHMARGTQSLLSRRPTGILGVEVGTTALSGFLDGVRGSTWPGESKQDMLREEMGQRGLGHTQVLVIGDTVDDLEAAMSVGAAVIICDSHSFAPVEAEILQLRKVPQVDNLLEAIDLALAMRAETSS
ncbi:HAD family hydrolase [Streptomyces sp. NPDC005529]|uniref:HAD family hydrolase n=1 Tax=unclassified Streptomyces TaxID=2593676 RepID=UPI0033B837D0